MTLTPWFKWEKATMPKNIKSDDEKFWIVISDLFGDEMFGPFEQYEKALEFAEDMDGSIFQCTEV